jgi:hypothetical protein
MVDPAARMLEVVTGAEVRRVLDDGAVALAAARDAGPTSPPATSSAASPAGSTSSPAPPAPRRSSTPDNP